MKVFTVIFLHAWETNTHARVNLYEMSTYKTCWTWSVSQFSTCMSLLRHCCQRHSFWNSQTGSQVYTFPDQMNWKFVQIFIAKFVAYFGFSSSVNHLSIPLREHIFTWASLEGHDLWVEPRSQSSTAISDVALGSKPPLVIRIARTGLGARLLWFVIGGFRSVLFVSCRKFLRSFSFLSLARIKQRLSPSFDKKSTHNHDFLRYSWAV